MASYLVPLLAAVIYVTVLFVVIVNGSRQKEHKLFVVYLVAAALWGFDDFLLRSNFLAGQKLLLFRIEVWSILWWVVQLYHFVRSFLGQPGGWGTKFGYASLAI